MLCLTLRACVVNRDACVVLDYAVGCALLARSEDLSVLLGCIKRCGASRIFDRDGGLVVTDCVALV